MPEESAYPYYIAPFEVVTHNKPKDCWVSFLGKVFDLTPLVREFEDHDSVRPFIAEAGKDISHWFDKHTGDIQHYVHPITGVSVPYCPHGPIPHVPPQVPTTAWQPIVLPWWKNKKYQIGFLTKRVRPIRIINPLIREEVEMNVCCEDTFIRILERYSVFNKDGSSYTWRFNDQNLDMSKTMEENGILDERDAFTDLGLPQSLYTPGVLIYYNDDLKWE